MKFFAAPNLVTLAVAETEPWTFVPSEPLTAQIRGDKESRQDFYQNAATKHNFYTMLEANTPNQRVSKENPPRLLHGFVADYDIKIPAERIAEAIKAMPFKPAFIEQSLGGNFRLVWSLESPLPVESRDFCTYILQKAHDWLGLGLLPGLDRKAFEETSRLYCNGCQWEQTGAPPIPVAAAQAFFVDCGKGFRFNAGDDAQVPLDVVEKALREKYPNFDWPGSFDLESQGPTFWIPESVSTQSAIVKPGGIFTFAAHASKPFYSWGDLLGKDFTDKFQADSVAKATADIWWDSQSFWRRKGGIYFPLGKEELVTYFKVSCRLSSKPGQNGISPIDAALDHIYNHQHVSGAAPAVFQKPGLILVGLDRRLNTYMNKPVEPAVGTQPWGALGRFPTLSEWLDCFFDPANQLVHMKAWFKHFYQSAFYWDPQPGQNFFLMGGAGTGKTFYNREIVGYAVGGYADASEFIVHGSQFNSQVLCYGHWTLDDDSPTNSPQAQMRAQAMFKKVAANQQMMRNAKYEKAAMVSWSGRIGCTTNLDFVSSRLVGPLDNSSLDKTCLFKCHKESKFKFPSRNEWLKIARQELPFLLRHLLDWEPPPEVERCARFGYKAFQEPSLLDRNKQTSPAASLKEVLIEFMIQWFKDNEEEPFWEGSVSTLLRQLLFSNGNEIILRSLKLEQISRYLEQIQREGSFRAEDRQGSHNVRLWRFYRHDSID
jgi:hypothetical protein